MDRGGVSPLPASTPGSLRGGLVLFSTPFVGESSTVHHQRAAFSIFPFQYAGRGGGFIR